MSEPILLLKGLDVSAVVVFTVSPSLSTGRRALFDFRRALFDFCFSALWLVIVFSWRRIATFCGIDNLGRAGYVVAETSA